MVSGIIKNPDKLLLHKYMQKIIVIVLAAILIALISSIAWSDDARADDYFQCFTGCSKALKDSSKCKGDILRGDYHRSAVNRAGGSDTIVLAIHAGEIETNTGEIAGAISGNNKWDFYTFVGHIKNQACKDLKPGSDKPNYDVLHITSTTFNDPIAIKKVNAHEKTISIHGHGKSHADGSICVGGLNDAQRKEFINYVNDNKASFKLYSLNPIDAPNKTSGDCSEDVLKGTDPDNIVNKNKSKKGLQLELNLQMRKDLVNPDANYDELRKIFYQGLKQAMSK